MQNFNNKKIKFMSKDKPGRDKKKLPNPVGKGAPSDYQSGKKSVSKIDVIPKKK
ncbi:hypothetical protein GCM10027049_14000 [Mucilaginibacter puniceus]